MTSPLAILRESFAMAARDDLVHNQPDLEHRVVQRTDGQMWEVRGFINPATLGVFSSHQALKVIDTRYPALAQHVTGQHTEIVDADIIEIIERIALPGEPHNAQIAAEVTKLIRSRTAYTPDFNEL